MRGSVDGYTGRGEAHGHKIHSILNSLKSLAKAAPQNGWRRSISFQATQAQDPGTQHVPGTRTRYLCTVRWVLWSCKSTLPVHQTWNPRSLTLKLSTVQFVPHHDDSLNMSNCPFNYIFYTWKLSLRETLVEKLTPLTDGILIQ